MDRKEPKKKKVTNSIDSNPAREFKIFSAYYERKMSSMLEEAMEDIMKKYNWGKYGRRF
ncbi:MAG: hypothetical protein M0Z64_11735 [Nitrospiraceae bacterium]|nr:hypothetical protein [Nitrospiraceae bacterium]